MTGKHPDNYCPVFGNYPKEYKRAVHGPYYPFVDYRTPKNTPLRDVKLGEFKSWFAKQEKTPATAIAWGSRAFWTWHNSYLGPKYGSYSKPFLQVMVVTSTLSLLLSYGYYKAERTHKYHW